MKILLIDDDSDFFLLAQRYIDKTVHTLATAKTILEAIQIIFKDPPDVILLDVFMPIQNGLNVCYELKKNPFIRDIPIIIISSLTTEDIKYLAEPIGGEVFISKSEGWEKIIEACVKTLPS